LICPLRGYYAASVTWLFLLASGTPSATKATASRPQAAQNLAARVGTTCGNPYGVAEIAFTFEVWVDGERVIQRSHEWFPRESRAIIRFDGHQVELTQLYPYIASEAPQELAIAAYQHWVNDSYWLLAACKVQDDGVETSLDEEGRLSLRFDPGVGLSAGDQYWMSVDRRGRVQDWEFELEGGRHDRFSWVGYKRFGPLLLSTRRISTDGHTLVRFENVRVR
jgi:hypothetical protein